MSEATQKCENRSIFMQNHQTLKAFIVFKKPVLLFCLREKSRFSRLTPKKAFLH